LKGRRGREMDIRIINSKDEIINVSELSIKVMGKYLVGMTAEAKIVEIEAYGSEEGAREVLREVVEVLKADVANIVIDLRSEEK
jgi:hypothetical protein